MAAGLRESKQLKVRLKCRPSALFEHMSCCQSCCGVHGPTFSHVVQEVGSGTVKFRECVIIELVIRAEFGFPSLHERGCLCTLITPIIIGRDHLKYIAYFRLYTL